jgi:hypothetical protein
MRIFPAGAHAVNSILMSSSGLRPDRRIKFLARSTILAALPDDGGLQH